MDGYTAPILTRQRSKTEAARDLVSAAHTALFYACDCQSMVAIKLIGDAAHALDWAATLLPPELAERSRTLADECGETLRGSLGYVITLEQRCSELHDELCAAVAGERERAAA